MLYAEEAGTGAGRFSGKGIYKRFGSLSVLENVDFSMGMTEAVGIVGPNGAGKTTLLATLAGAFPPSAEMIFVKYYEIPVSGVYPFIFSLNATVGVPA